MSEKKQNFEPLVLISFPESITFLRLERQATLGTMSPDSGRSLYEEPFMSVQVSGPLKDAHTPSF